MKRILLLLMGFCLLSVHAAEWIVDGEQARRMIPSSLAKYEELTGRDSGSLVALWLARGDSMQSISRSGSVFSAGVAGGAWDSRGFAGEWFARRYDGISDYDTVASSFEDSLDWKGGFWLEILFSGSGADYAPLWRKYDDGGTGYILGFHTDGLIRAVANTSVITTTQRYDDNRWHSLRMAGWSDSLALTVDDETVGLAFQGNCVNDEPVLIGSGGANYYFAGSIALVAFHDGVPGDIERDTLFHLLKNHWNGILPFLSPQTALDCAQDSFPGDGVVDTITLLPSRYPAPLEIRLDSLILRGRSPLDVILDGSGISRTCDAIRLDSCRELSIENLQLRSFSGYGLRIGRHSSARISRLIIDNMGTCALVAKSGGVDDTLRIDHCTLSGAPVGIRISPDDSSRVMVTNSIIALVDSAGIRYSGQGSVSENYNIFWRTNPDLEGVSPGLSSRHCNPLFRSAPLGNYMLTPFSPALHADSQGFPCGATAPSIQYPLPGWGRSSWGNRLSVRDQP